jgi:hypothetical protein
VPALFPTKRCAEFRRKPFAAPVAAFLVGELSWEREENVLVRDGVSWRRIAAVKAWIGRRCIDDTRLSMRSSRAPIYALVIGED